MNLSQRLISNNGLKIVALVAAVFIWLFVKAVTSDSRTMDGVPLEVKAPPGMTATYVTPRSVNVTVRGTTEDLRQSSRAELFAVVDLQREGRIGRVMAPITLRDIRHPRRIQVIAVEPTNAIVRLEKAVE
ncbi:MAG: CdaR family protein [Verrucomicrobiota bacterium]|jgi:YbbR domain-containing protein